MIIFHRRISINNLSLTPSHLSFFFSFSLFSSSAAALASFMHSKTLFSSMSNQELLLIKDGKEDLSKFEILKRPMLKIQSDQSIETLSSSFNSHYSQDKEEGNSNQEIEEFHQICRIKVPKLADSESSTPSTGEKLKVEDDDDDEEEEEEDGFKTPTSLDHRISVATQCPPAPRKTKPSLKRKASYYNNHCHCRHPLDLSKEVFELLFPTQTQHINPLSDSQQSTKKVRREEPK